MLLMVSVINPEEVPTAIAGGADILDVKNPAEGSLGAASAHILQNVRAITPDSVQVSAAIGDMPNLPGTASLAALGAASCGIDYVKVGLYGPKSEGEAIYLLSAVRQAVRGFPGVKVIVGGYADAQRAATLDPSRLPGIARKAGISGCLLDTYVKDGHNLFDFLTPEALRSLAVEAHAGGLLFALAGALQAEHLEQAYEVGADIVGVRTAACRDNQRKGPLEVEKIRLLRRQVGELAAEARQEEAQG
jgi:(5-formylfuran-3-yl)methyl phosphate synthase